MNNKSILYSCFLTNVGYTRAALGYIRSLLYINNNLKINCIHNGPHGNSFTKDEIEVIKKNLDSNCKSADICIEHVIPNRWRKELKGKKKVFIAVYENEKVDPAWVSMINNDMDFLVYPSQWNKYIFENSGVNKNGIVIPHLLDESIWKFEQSKVEAHKVFSFCMIATWRERKNWKLAFESFEKLSKSYEFTIGVKTDKPRDLMLYVENKHPCLLNKIIVESKELDDVQMSSYISRHDCVVSFSYGEAFCLPLLQSLFLDKPFVSTDIPGVKDYLNNSFGCFIPQSGTIRKDKMDHYPQFYNKEWPYFDSEEACRALAKIIEKYDTYKYNIKSEKNNVISKFGLKGSIIHNYWDQVINL